MGIPLNERHAIESASFIIVYEKPFPEAVVNSLVSLQEILKEEFPLFQQLNIVELRFDQESPTSQPTLGKVSGVLLQNVNGEGKQTWVLRIEANTVILTAFEYERWTPVSEKALKILTKVGAPLFDQENPVVVVGFQVIDKFIAKPEVEYSIGDVFDTDSEFLNKQIFNAGRLWHLYQGWFDNVSDTSRRLNVLNVATNDTVDGLVTSIDHNIQLQSRISSSQVIEDEGLKTIFNDLHQSNKCVISKLLNEAQKKYIKLNYEH